MENSSRKRLKSVSKIGAARPPLAFLGSRVDRAGTTPLPPPSRPPSESQGVARGLAVRARSLATFCALACACLGALGAGLAACSGEDGADALDAGADDPSDDASASDDASRGERPTRPGEDGAVDPIDPVDAAVVRDAASAFDAGVCPDPGNPTLAPALQGAPAYVATFGPSSRTAAHGANPNPAGRACINCHNPGGTGRPFFFAGTAPPKPLITVANDAGPDGGDAGTRRVDAGVFPIQVVVREAQGRLLSVTTDADGNFFYEAKPDAGACLSGPLRAAFRRDAATKVMQNPRSSGNCNGCHTVVAP